jgi:hypothetical protein
MDVVAVGGVSLDIVDHGSKVPAVALICPACAPAGAPAIIIFLRLLGCHSIPLLSAMAAMS